MRDRCMRFFFHLYGVKNVLNRSFTCVNSLFPCIFALSKSKKFSHTTVSMRILSTSVLFYFMTLVLAVAAEDFDLTQIYQQKQCLECHQKTNPDLVSEWQNSGHGEKTNPAADCIQCHGNSHQDALKKSRPNSVCINCHGGKKSPLVHSYSTSKHGAIMQMRKNKTDWSKRLKLANYRVPGCSYCHMHDKQHNTKITIRSKASSRTANQVDMEIHFLEKRMQQTVGVCFNCHSLRYIKRLFENGESMLAIAQKKLDEAQQLLDQLTSQYPDKTLTPIRKQFKRMRKHHHNVYLGIAHQSPDYQWWHGQPALDGDLINIKSMISDLQRREKLIQHKKVKK